MRKRNAHSKKRKWGVDPLEEFNNQSDEPHFPAKVDLHDVVFYRDLHRFISRYWKPHISPAEYSVLDMIFDRTIGWGKLWEWISLNQFVDGVWNEKQVYSDGTGCGKRTVQRALEGLLRKSLILRKQTKGYMPRYALNFFWKAPKLEYRNGKTPYRPHGSESYWERIAAGGSQRMVTIIQRERQGFYDTDIVDGTELEIQG